MHNCSRQDRPAINKIPSRGVRRGGLRGGEQGESIRVGRQQIPHSPQIEEEKAIGRKNLLQHLLYLLPSLQQEHQQQERYPPRWKKQNKTKRYPRRGIIATEINIPAEGEEKQKKKKKIHPFRSRSQRGLCPPGPLSLRPGRRAIIPVPPVPAVCNRRSRPDRVAPVATPRQAGRREPGRARTLSVSPSLSVSLSLCCFPTRQLIYTVCPLHGLAEKNRTGNVNLPTSRLGSHASKPNQSIRS